MSTLGGQRSRLPTLTWGLIVTILLRMLRNSHARRTIVTITLVMSMVFLIPSLAEASTNTSAEQQQEFNEWYYASQENQDYYHWYTWVNASPENEAYWRWKVEQDRQAQARASRVNSVDAAITAYFGGPDTWLGAQARRVVQCESEGNPNAVSRTNDHGIFQINKPSHYYAFPRITGSPFYNGVYDPYENAQYARHLYNDRNGWGHWTCKP